MVGAHAERLRSLRTSGLCAPLATATHSLPTSDLSLSRKSKCEAASAVAEAERM